MAVSPTVLIVDDEPHVRVYLSMLLRAILSDVRLLEAADDAAALAQCREARPALVLLDINLVGSSGLELLPRLLAVHPDAVVVMLTAVNVRHAVEEALAKGAAGYLLKDQSMEELKQALIEVVRDNFDVDETPEAQP